jgi:curved DNA-binding protein CbpA
MKPRDDETIARSPAEERLSQKLATTAPRISTLPPEAFESLEDERADAGEELVRAWAAAIDAVDYLAILQLPEDGAFDDDELRKAFHGFARAFHPDRWRDAGDDVRAGANAVYCRGGEGYKVLQDPLLRKRYLRLRASGKLRMPPEEIAQSARGDASAAPASIESIARSPQSIPFARRADELLAQGNPRQAKLQVQLALAKEPGNARLEERLTDLEELVKALRPAVRKPLA